MVRVPGVQAAEGVLGQAEGGSSVQVAVPPDLDAYDASLWVASRDRASFPPGPFRNEACRRPEEKPGPAPTSMAMSWKLCPAFSTILPRRKMGQKGSVRAS